MEGGRSGADEEGSTRTSPPLPLILVKVSCFPIGDASALRTTFTPGVDVIGPECTDDFSPLWACACVLMHSCGSAA